MEREKQYRFLPHMDTSSNEGFTHTNITSFDSDIAGILLDHLPLFLPSILLATDFLVLFLTSFCLHFSVAQSQLLLQPPQAPPVTPSSPSADRAIRALPPPRSAAQDPGGQVSTSLPPRHIRVPPLLLRIPAKQRLFCFGLGSADLALWSCSPPPRALP